MTMSDALPDPADDTPPHPLRRYGTRPLVVAHRGASGIAPENTHEAFDAAWAAGTDWLETDVRPSRDDSLVLIHDSSVDRTTDGSGTVRRLTADELAALDAGTRFHRNFAGSRIPTLDGLLARMAPPRHLLLEIKGNHTEQQLRTVVRTLHDAGIGDRYLMQSFGVPVLERLRAILPGEPVGLLAGAITGDPVAECRRLGAVTYNPRADELLAQPALVDELHAADIATVPWTVNEPHQWAALTELGVDGMITDYPGDLVAWQRAHPMITRPG